MPFNNNQVDPMRAGWLGDGKARGKYKQRNGDIPVAPYNQPPESRIFFFVPQKSIADGPEP